MIKRLFTWLWTRLLLIYQYLLIRFKGYQFDSDAKIAVQRKLNRETLFKILKQNRNTKFLKDKRKETNIDPEESLENFRKVFPNYTEYDTYQSYVEQILTDGQTPDILSVGFPIALTNSSGTSGTPKNFPVYSLHINEPFAIAYRMIRSIGPNIITGGKSVCLNSLKYDTHETKDRLKSYKVSAITIIAAREQQNLETILKHDQNIVPYIIYDQISQQNDLFLLIAIWALQAKDLESISTVFVMALIHFFTYIEEKFDFICKHIELGTIPADESFKIPISVDVRLALQSQPYHLPPNPTRADELRQIVAKHGFHHANTNFWPQLKYGFCIISRNIRQFELKLLASYWNPDIPIYPYVYGMSEHHRIAIPVKPNSYELIPQPRSVFYEFIEVDNDNDDDDDENEKPVVEAKELHELEQDKFYEVLLTTYDGLYRYRTQDIIQIIGHYYSLPTWQLIGRLGQYLSISREHVTEIELREILDSILFQCQNEFTSTSPQYSVFIEKKSYALAIETDDEKQSNKDHLQQIGKDILTKFDEQLQQSNENYKLARENKRIAFPILFWLKNNTLTTGIRNFRADPKHSGTDQNKAPVANQLKSQLILKKKLNKKVIDFVKENVVF